MNLKNTCTEVISVVKRTAEFIEAEGNKREGLNVESKGIHNYVTHVDRQAEEMLVKGLMEIIPQSGFITEEGTIEKTSDRYYWVIDPLDGTTNFIHGLPPFAVSVALMDTDEIVIGVIFEIGLKECFYAWKDSPAYMNGKVIRVTTTSKVSDSLIATGFPYSEFKYLPQFMDSLHYFMKNSHGLRRLGSAATDIAYVACGRFEGFYEYGLNSWDIAAGILILQQAGGKVSDFKGGADYLFGKEIIASNSGIFDEFQQAVQKIMNV